MARVTKTMFAGLISAALFICCTEKMITFATATDDVTSTARRLRSTSRSRRRLISKDDNIVDVLSDLDGTHVDVGPLGFDIEVEEDDGAGLADPSSVSFDSTTLLLHLDLMTPAVTSNTVLYFPERSSLMQEKVDASKITFLASSPSSTTRDLTVVSVNTNSGEVNGLQQHGESGKIKQIAPKNSNSPTLQLRPSSMSSEPRKFDHDTDHDDYLHRHRHMADAFQSDHDDTGHHIHDQGEPNLSEESVNTTSVRNAVSETAHKGFQIDLIVDIDRQLIKQNGGLERAVEYVNYIVSTTNIILNSEFDLRLNVVQISETHIFDKLGFGTIRDALKLMRETYGGTVGKDKGAQLRHAMLGNELGGGIAFTDAVCDSSWGFGISSGLRGEINKMDLYDVFMFAHELGHNLGSGHPFDAEYAPPVDTCQQNSCPKGLPLKDSSTLMSYCGHFCGGMSNTAFTYGGVWDQVSPRENVTSWLQNPALIESPISKDAQRISHNIWMKLSEKEDCIRKHDPLSVAPLSTIFMVDKDDNETSAAASPASNVTSVLEETRSPSPSLSPIPSQTPSVSVSPTVSSAPSSAPSASLSPTVTVTSVPSSAPTLTSKPTLSPSSSPSSSPSARPSSSPTANPSNTPSFRPTKGAHSISPLKHCDSRCKRTNGYMFNVKLEANASYDIEINSINFRHKAPSVHRVIWVYMIKEGYQGKEELTEEWTQIGTGRAPKRNNIVSTVYLDQPLRIKAGETIGFYLRTEESIMLVGKFAKTATIDVNDVKLQYGLALMNSNFAENFSWSGSVEYQIVDN